jgi:glucose-1-phosphate thymidylyltransferase
MTHQRDQKGLAHALSTVEEHIDDHFMLIRDNIFQANLEDVVRRQQEERADAAFLVEEVEWEELNRYGACDTNKHGEVTDVVEKPSDPPSNLVMTGFYTFSPAIFHACHLMQPPNRGEYEISKDINLLIQTWRTIDAIGLEGWRIDIGFPEDREEAEERLTIDKSDSMGDLQSEVES